MRLLISLHFVTTFFFFISVCTVECRVCMAGEIATATEFGQEVLVLSQGDTVARLAPSAGANLFSIRVGGTEFLHQPASAEKLSGVSCGVPILYPTPNRVKDSSFTFEGKKVDFKPNAGPNFIHGLVNRTKWLVLAQKPSDDSAEITLLADFENDTDLAPRFPFPHRLLLTITVRDASIRWRYTVDNRSGKTSVPFGFALHPYFRYQGTRADTFLTIPASHWMQSERQLPSGTLIPAKELDYALKKPITLEGTKFDDVFFGVSGNTLIDFRSSGHQISIVGSPEFTHLVVWTPDRPFFGIENQTCSTDAHNLYANGYQRESNLQICPSGKVMAGWVEYRFSNEPN
ncbi:MAG: aldose 1-epimerase [Aureliella sp.]